MRRTASMSLAVVLACAAEAAAQGKGVSHAVSAGGPTVSSGGNGPYQPGGGGVWHGGRRWRPGFVVVAPPWYAYPPVVVAGNPAYAYTGATFAVGPAPALSYFDPFTMRWAPVESYYPNAAAIAPLAGVNLDPDPAARPAPAPNPARRAERVEERLTVGDRLFRAGEFNRAADRYTQAAEADPTRAEPLVRLAQVALARDDYAEAARRLREAQAVEPDWMLRPAARSPQNLFGGPADFAAVLNRLESHLQTNPEDRDAWLVLGAELYLTGRTAAARDCFVRLTDRRPDETLAAFLEATRPPDDEAVRR
jgi:hypothetical protein